MCNEEEISSSLIININQFFADKNVNFQRMIFGFDQFNELCQKYDVILLAPYFSFYYEKYSFIATKYQTIFLKISAQAYETKNIAMLIEQIKSTLKI